MIRAVGGTAKGAPVLVALALLVLASGLLAAAMPAPAQASGEGGAKMPLVWDLPTTYPDDNLHTENIRWFVAEVREDTGGELAIQVHPDGVLVPPGEIFEAVARGEVAFGEVLVSSLAARDPLFEVDSIPFVASDYEKAKKLDRISRPYLEKRLAAMGVRLLYTVPWPPQGLYADKPVARVADLRGLRLRVYDAGTARIAELVGARPIHVEAREVRAAFMGGRVDAMITSAATGVDSRAWEFVDRFYDLGAWLPRNMVVVNAAAFDALPAVLRETLMAAAVRAGLRGWAASASAADYNLATLAAEGMTVAAPGPEMTEEFRMVGSLMLSEWLGRTGADGVALIADFVR